MDNDRCRVGGSGNVDLRKRSFLLLQVLRKPGEFEERALQDCAEIVRSANNAKPLHGLAWASLSSSSHWAVPISVRRRYYALSCFRAGIHHDTRPLGTAFAWSHCGQGRGLSVLPRKRATPGANPKAVSRWDRRRGAHPNKSASVLYLCRKAGCHFEVIVMEPNSIPSTFDSTRLRTQFETTTSTESFILSGCLTRNSHRR